jgi:hypothetical protein
MNRQTEKSASVLDEESLAFLIKALNTFDDQTAFTCNITDSLIDHFISFLCRGGYKHIDHVYKICKDTCKTQVLTKVFATIFIHDKTQFSQQTPICDYDRAVQDHIFAWLAKVLVANRHWNKLPERLGRATISHCFYHTHGEGKDCYEDG